ncbi:MAG TPA: CoA transferase [Candidatus Limnocylindrales bacterium]|nr:CoA transferase [Candidatus Limnocylindrales bacterium]
MPDPRPDPPETAPPGPLAGLRVVDCSTVLAGPFCTMLLADLGADVVKVEPLDGDGTRGWGPPWVGREEDGTRTAAYYLAVNRNKRSIRLDLRAAPGRAVLERLILRGDVLIENFRAGGLDRLGFDDATLAAINPRLVHLAISGYGPGGPAAEKPGYDFVVQAVGGLMSITGAPDSEGGTPTKVGVAISDVASGLFGAVAVLAALLGRERRPGGTAAETADGGADTRADRKADGSADERAGGERIDVSLLGSTLALLVNQAQNAFVSGRSPERRGNAHPNIVPYQPFATSDGTIAVAVGSERQWTRLCMAIDRPDLATDRRFATNGDRVDQRDVLVPLLATAFASDTTDAWLARLESADVPCGPINDVLAAFDDPSARALGMRVGLDHPALGRIDQIGIPFHLARRPATVRTPPPLLGEHSAEILAELGYDTADIDGLRASGVI